MNDCLRSAIESIEKQRKEKTFAEEKPFAEFTIESMVYIIIGDIILDFLDDIIY